MSITSAAAEDFPARVRDRGAEYFARGSVKIVRAGSDTIVAHVQGSLRYVVEIDLHGDSVECRCTCPFASDWAARCKHMWAALLAAEKAGLSETGEDGFDLIDERDLLDQTVAMPDSQDDEKHPAWRKTLRRLREVAHRQQNASTDASITPIPEDRRIVYMIDVAATKEGDGGLVIEVMTQRRRRRDGVWERPKAFGFDQRQWMSATDPADRTLAQMLMGARNGYEFYSGSGLRQFVIHAPAFATTLRLMCETGRCGVKFTDKQEALVPLRWDDSGAWEFVVGVAIRPDGERVELRGSFDRGGERMAIDGPSVVVSGGLLIAHDLVAQLEHHGAWTMLQTMRDGVAIHAAATQVDDLLRELVSLPRVPRLELDPSIQIQQIDVTPRPVVTLKRPRQSSEHLLPLNVAFDYGGRVIDSSESMGALFDDSQRRLIRRDVEREQQSLARLKPLGVRSAWVGSRSALYLPAAQLHAVVMTLVAEGWDVQAEGAVYRRPGAMRVSVGSGIDWFELSGGIEFDGKIVPLPRLLGALRGGQNTIKLDDGSIGLLPMEWLAKYAPLVGVGEDQQEGGEETIRFSRVQIGLLDALLATIPEARIDETFAQARRELTAFDRIESVDAPPGFTGVLRPYQRDGMGWLSFLQRFQFGGCLADDMGLGKTVQVLALLESRRQQQPHPGPSLVVVPRSLVFNWKAEAQRFTPDIRILDHSGINRTRAADHFSQFDLILTTYGTLRRDVPYFKDTTFDYVILDEAQAIKNATTEAAKATRLVRARHRLALSGTPIENRLAELWSLFEFLNPGMLGAASVFQALIGNGQELEGRQMLARALRPFILRRTKEQVAPELPEKLEQTIHCDLESSQRKLYDELRQHYRQSLLGQIDADGINRSKIQILEALLRLRQAACHPGLIDKSRSNEPSAKLEALLEHLSDVLAEGHKALVFSQFTSLLSIVRMRLDEIGTTYEYLDGKTRDRQRRVDRFQNDASCRLFLISLKAGGLGLNLTAADYVFLLDPWWNPAVEAQAIDRTHRIGQTRRVFAYRLIARDTVEEKVLQLQQSKRDLAAAIITADNSLIRSLKREDLELLLS